MTKARKRKGASAKTQEPPPTPAANLTRARDIIGEIDWGGAIELWVSLIGNGETERHAASLVALDFPGVTRSLLRARCEADPEGWGEALAAAHGRKVAKFEKVLRDIAEGPGPNAGLLSTDPQLERVRASTAQWLLSKWDRETYGDAKKVEQSGPGGGPIQHSHGAVVKYELHVPANPLTGDDSSDD
jgi:hypothetical protein